MRSYNFNGGPAALPLEVLEQVQAELLDWKGTGMSLMENSHRSKEIVAMAKEAEDDVKKLLNLNDDWAVLFCQGGASLQFAMIPMCFAAGGGKCDYINTGLWSTKAFKEAKHVGAKARLAASSEADDFTFIPEKFDFDSEANYVYLTSNNTVRGTQWKNFPNDAPAPLIADMSSDFLSRPMDLSKFSLVYAGAQKNVGPAGLTVVLVRKEFAAKAEKSVPTLLNYNTYIENESMYNTPPVFAIYVAGLVFKWLLNKVGGLEKMAQINEAKTGLIYQAIDQSGGFYRGTAQVGSRSLMNVTFRLPSEELDVKFKKEAEKNNLFGLGGHRSVGGLRASVYNAVPEDSIKKLVQFMDEFKRTNG